MLTKVWLRKFWFLGLIFLLYYSPLKTEASPTETTVSELLQIKDALLLYLKDQGYFPLRSSNSNPASGDQGLPALIYEPLEAPAPYSGVWKGPYISKSLNNLIKDDWGNPYQYHLYKNCPLSCTEITAFDGDLFNINIEQIVKITSNGEDLTDQTADDIEVNLSSSALMTKLKEETLRRLSVTRQVLQNHIDNNPSTTLIGDLLNKSTPLAVEGDGSAAEAKDLAKTHLGSFFITDPWGREFRWDDNTGQFFSTGPLRLDRTTIATTIHPLNIPTGTSLTLPPPQSFSVTVASPTQINITFNPVSGSSSYRLYSSGNDSAYSSSQENSTTLQRSGLDCGDDYYYKVRAINQFSDVEKSQTTSLSVITPIPTPTSFITIPYNPVQINLSWAKLDCASNLKYLLFRNSSNSFGQVDGGDHG